jgi:hypothetical protein
MQIHRTNVTGVKAENGKQKAEGAKAEGRKQKAEIPSPL